MFHSALSIIDRETALRCDVHLDLLHDQARLILARHKLPDLSQPRDGVIAAHLTRLRGREVIVQVHLFRQSLPGTLGLSWLMGKAVVERLNEGWQERVGLLQSTDACQ